MKAARLRRHLLLALVVALASGPAIDAQAQQATGIEPLVSAHTVMAARLRLDRIDVRQLDEILSGPMPRAEGQPSAWGEPLAEIQAGLDRFRSAGIKELFVLINLPTASEGAVVAMAEPADPAMREQLREFFQDYFEKFGLTDTAAIRGMWLAGSVPALEHLAFTPATARPELATAWQSLGDSDVQIALLLSDDARRVLRETLVLPEPLGGQNAVPAVANLRWLAFGANLPPRFRAQLHFQSHDATNARQLVEHLRTAVQWAREQPREPWQSLRKLSEATRLEQTDAQISWTLTELDEQTLRALLSPVKRAREQARLNVCRGHLKGIALAFHNYLDTHGRFPARANFSADGRPLLSWRVHLLPYVDQDQLYRQFRLDEPWDSEHNRALIRFMPEIFACPSAALQPGHTTYLVPTGEHSAFAGQEGMKVQDIRDGTSNTIMVMDVAPERAVVWTRPDDYAFDADNPLAGLIQQHDDVFVVALFDGSVLTLSAPRAAKQVRLLIDPNDGMVIEP